MSGDGPTCKAAIGIEKRVEMNGQIMQPVFDISFGSCAMRSDGQVGTSRRLGQWQIVGGWWMTGGMVSWSREGDNGGDARHHTSREEAVLVKEGFDFDVLPFTCRSMGIYIALLGQNTGYATAHPVYHVVTPLMNVLCKTNACGMGVHWACSTWS
jgi:hypothetical protein